MTEEAPATVVEGEVIEMIPVGEMVQGFWGDYTRTATDESYYTDLQIYNEKLEEKFSIIQKR